MSDLIIMHRVNVADAAFASDRESARLGIMQGRAQRSRSLPTPAESDRVEDPRVESAPNETSPAEPSPSRRGGIGRGLAEILVAVLWRGLLFGVLAAIAGGVALALLEPQAGAGRTLGHLIDLRRFGDGTAYLTHGWSSPDEAGSATRGLLSQLTLPVDRAEPPAQLFLIARPRFAPDEEEFWVDLLIDGTARTRWLFSRSAPSNRWLTAPIGPNPAKTLNIALVIGSRDPSESGAGLTIETISLKPPL